MKKIKPKETTLSNKSFNYNNLSYDLDFISTSPDNLNKLTKDFHSTRIYQIINYYNKLNKQDKEKFLKLWSLADKSKTSPIITYTLGYIKNDKQKILQAFNQFINKTGFFDFYIPKYNNQNELLEFVKNKYGLVLKKEDLSYSWKSGKKTIQDYLLISLHGKSNAYYNDIYNFLTSETIDEFIYKLPKFYSFLNYSFIDEMFLRKILSFKEGPFILFSFIEFPKEHKPFSTLNLLRTSPSTKSIRRVLRLANEINKQELIQFIKESDKYINKHPNKNFFKYLQYKLDKNYNLNLFSKDDVNNIFNNLILDYINSSNHIFLVAASDLSKSIKPEYLHEYFSKFLSTSYRNNQLINLCELFFNFSGKNKESYLRGLLYYSSFAYTITGHKKYLDLIKHYSQYMSNDKLFDFLDKLESRIILDIKSSRKINENEKFNLYFLLYTLSKTYDFDILKQRYARGAFISLFSNYLDRYKPLVDDLFNSINREHIIEIFEQIKRTSTKSEYLVNKSFYSLSKRFPDRWEILTYFSLQYIIYNDIMCLNMLLDLSRNSKYISLVKNDVERRCITLDPSEQVRFTRLMNQFDNYF